jgi:hypothetical protein
MTEVELVTGLCFSNLVQEANKKAVPSKWLAETRGIGMGWDLCDCVSRDLFEWCF